MSKAADTPGDADRTTADLAMVPPDLDAYVPYLLNRLTNIWNVNQTGELNAFGINATLLRTLAVLAIHDTLTVNEIANYAVVEQSNASRTIVSMVTAGLVRREISASDLRRREIALTEAGAALLKQLWPIQHRNYERLVRNIPERNLKICIETLQAMIRNISDDQEA